MGFTLHYEAVRAQALGEPSVGAAPLGLVVVLRRGLADWLTTCAQAMARQDTPVARRLGQAGPTPQTVLSGLRGEAVRVLASMALAAAEKGGV